MWHPQVPLAEGVGLIVGSSRVMVADKGHSSENTDKEAQGLRRRQLAQKTSSLHTCHDAVFQLQKENLVAKGW